MINIISIPWNHFEIMDIRRRYIELKMDRDANIDCAKGLAAIIVVLGHFVEMTVFRNAAVGNTIDFICYTLHVPTFLFCSGYLFNISLNRYTSKRIIAYNFMDSILVWIFWGTILLFYNRSVDFFAFSEKESFIDCAKYSFNQLWYFWFLFVCYLVTLIIIHFKIPNEIIYMLLCIFVVCFSFISISLDKLIVHYLMFFMGYCHYKKRKYVVPYLILAYLVLLLCSIMMGITMLNLFATWYSTLFVFSIKILGSVVLYLIFLIGNKYGYQIFGLLDWLGKRTLYIYIFHFFILAIYRRLYFHSLWVMVLFVISGIVFSLIVKKLIDNCGIAYVVKPSVLLKNR